MNSAERNFAQLIAVMRQQLALSQEDLARHLGVSYVTVNRWENGHCKPSRLARSQLDAFCTKMIVSGQLVLLEEQRP